MSIQETLPLGVVLERRRSDHPWQDHVWNPVGVIPGAPALDPGGPWTLLREGEGFAQYHGGTLTLSLFRKETEAYKVNLSQDPPRIFVVLRSEVAPGSGHDFVPFLVTASPYEAEGYLTSGEEIVEGVPMPADLIAFIQDYVELHHVDEPFYKRKRKGAGKGKDRGPGAFERRPPVGPSGSRNG